MNILKKILFVLLGIVSSLLVAAAILPKSIRIRVTENINRPKAEVYDYLKLFANQKEYSEWTKPDPNLVPHITGTDGTVGSSSHWKSDNENVGEGRQTIAAMTESTIDLDLEFISPMAGTAKVTNTINAIDSTSTKVTVDFYSEAKFPMNLLSILVGKPMIEKTEKQILKNVKDILEAKTK